jgi:hypothetical protein
MALTGLAALLAVIAGCGEKEDPRPSFEAELQNHFRILNREAADAKEDGAPLVHEYRDVRYPSADATGMPTAKRRHLDPTGGDEKVEGAYSAVVAYTLVTLERQMAKQAIPKELVSVDSRPEMIDTAEKIQAVYKPVRYAKGRQLFAFKGGRLIAHPVPYEEPMTVEEQKQVIQAPIKKEEIPAATEAPVE